MIVHEMMSHSGENVEPCTVASLMKKVLFILYIFLDMNKFIGLMA